MRQCIKTGVPLNKNNTVTVSSSCDENTIAVGDYHLDAICCDTTIEALRSEIADLEDELEDERQESNSLDNRLTDSNEENDNLRDENRELRTANGDLSSKIDRPGHK